MNRLLQLLLISPLLLLGADSAAHHSSTHDQNPSPPAVLGPTDVISFKAGTLIIPMDGCYARTSYLAGGDLDQVVQLTYESSSANRTNKVCNSTTAKDDGLIPAYTMVQRLIRDGVTVHWSIRAAKTGWHDWDFKVTNGGGSPVKRINKSGSTTTNSYASLTEIRYAGAPFLIDSADAKTAHDLMATYTQSDSGTDYDDVDIHIAMVDFEAPIYSSLDKLPKLAVLKLDDAATDLQNEKSGMLINSLDEAMMDDMEGDWYDIVTIPDVNAGTLLDGAYELVWVPPFDLKTGVAPTAAQTTFIDNLEAYVDQGGHILFQDGAIAAMEGWGDWSTFYDQKQVPTAGFQTNGGLIANGVTSSWDNGNDDEVTVGQDYSDPASQFGGNVWTGIGGSKYNWKPRYDRAYHEGVRRMIYTDHKTDSTKDRWDIATWRHKDNDSDKGVVYYLGGFHWRRVTAAGFRVLLNTIFVHAHSTEETIIVEASRSSPVVATVAGVEAQFQGSYEIEVPAEAAPTYADASDAAIFEFPDVLGHLRAIDVANVSDADSVDPHAEITAIWDAADGIPPASSTGCSTSFTTSCRTVFSNTSTGTTPNQVLFTEANVSSFTAKMGLADDADATILLQRVLAGRDDGAGGYVSKLGGVDRSTLALIEQSPIIGNVRPTMAYFGARDGMLHAVCADSVDYCQQGKELWAYIPRTQLPFLRLNTAVVQGSPKVADVFGEFGGPGVKEYRTILVMQTGNGDATAANQAPVVFAIDVTNPNAPDLLWELELPGAGLGLAMGPITVTGGTKNAVFVQTNLHSGGPGIHVAAIQTDTGAALWPAQNIIHDPGARSGANADVPDSAIPGGLAAVDLVGQNTLSHIVVPTIFGEFWLFDATTGTNVFGANPMFRFSADFNPVGASPTVYFDASSSKFHALVVSGGYADENPISWSPSDVVQYAVSVPLDTNAPAPLDETTVPNIGGFVIDLGAGNRAFGQATVAGNELFIVTDTEDINVSAYGTSSASGTLRRYTLGGSPTLQATVNVPSGAAAVDVSMSSGRVHVGGGAPVRIGLTDFDSSGSSAELIFEASSSRTLWLRLR